MQRYEIFPIYEQQEVTIYNPSAFTSIYKVRQNREMLLEWRDEKKKRKAVPTSDFCFPLIFALNNDKFSAILFNNTAVGTYRRFLSYKNEIAYLWLIR